MKTYECWVTNIQGAVASVGSGTNKQQLVETARNTYGAGWIVTVKDIDRQEEVYVGKIRKTMDKTRVKLEEQAAIYVAYMRKFHTDARIIGMDGEGIRIHAGCVDAWHPCGQNVTLTLSDFRRMKKDAPEIGLI